MCGIAGILTRKKDRFDYRTFCILGLAQDSRGGDSCGVYIDGKYEYGTGGKKLFKDFFHESEVINGSKRTKTAFVHCRKASIGGVGADKAQPVVITEGGEPVFVLIHNGTIYNYRELAKKHIPEVNVEGMSDSQVMARIFYYSGYDVLSEYNGGSVFVTHDVKRGTTYMFQGVSKYTRSSKEPIEERPFYLYKDEDRVVFSSIYSYLKVLCGMVYTLKANTLYEYKRGKLASVREYPRNDVFQKEEGLVTYNYPTYGYQSWGYGYNGSMGEELVEYVLEEDKYYDGVRPANGEYSLTYDGMIVDRPSFYPRTREVCFFNGVMLADKKCLDMLTDAAKDSKMKQVLRNHPNLIRSIGADNVYRDKDMWYEALTPKERKPYTGLYRPRLSNKEITVKDGKMVDVCYKLSKSSLFTDTFNTSNNLEACLSMMKELARH